MRLLLQLALTHVLGRGRQTVVAGLGVALGVGFSVAMAALMQGLAGRLYPPNLSTPCRMSRSPTKPGPRRRSRPRRFSMRRASLGFARSTTRAASATLTAARVALEAWVPGRVAVSLRTEAVARYSGRDAGVAVIGIGTRGRGEGELGGGGLPPGRVREAGHGGQQHRHRRRAGREARRRARQHHRPSCPPAAGRAASASSACSTLARPPATRARPMCCSRTPRFLPSART